ncbi:FMN-binding protein [Streptomyces sp. NPDC127098]|uniref:FMN-binding protein n=1 Tax=Streptomyces sp. NPDC127098 TaxID=3347137 RepID=UPI00365DF7B4
MRRMAAATVTTVAGVVLLLSLKPHQSPPAATAPPPSDPPSADASPGTAPEPTGTFTGDVVTTQYGPVQVAVTLDQGRITDVEVLRAPSENGRDQEISAYAVPKLTQETLSAQSAHIDAVSGASYTSAGYVESLQSALDQAGG